MIRLLQGETFTSAIPPYHSISTYTISESRKDSPNTPYLSTSTYTIDVSKERLLLTAIYRPLGPL